MSTMAAGLGPRPAAENHQGTRRRWVLPTRLFPLPRPGSESSPRPSLSRGCRQRVQRRVRAQEDVGDCIAALNWLSGFREPVEVRTTAAHVESLSAIADAVHARELPDHFETPEEAACALLRAHPAGYDGGEGQKNTVPYKAGQVSLPESSRDCPLLSSVLPADARDLLCGFETHMLRGLSELLELRDHSERIKPHMDPVLERDHGKYVGFVRELLGRGVLQWTLDPAEFVGLFFVPKKDNRLRLIVDARASNQHFRAPPGVVLAGPEVFANLEVSPEARVFCAETDVKDCFYRLRILEAYGRYFCLPPVAAKEFGVAHVGGKIVRPGDLIYPCLAVLPMGHNWSLYFAQRSSEHQVGHTPTLSRAQPLRGDGTHVSLSERAPISYYVYVDNAGVLGTDPNLVNQAIVEVVSALGAVGLACHEPRLASLQCETLGVEFDSQSHGFRPTGKRYWRIRQALRFFLRSGRASGRQMEILAGHLTFFCMLYRGALSVFNAIYKFIKSSYDRVTRLWPEVVEELVAFRGLMPLIRSRWDLPWSDTVRCYDSCDTGWGVASRTWEIDDITAVGRTLERSRFRRTVGGLAPRQAALRQLDPFSDRATVLCDRPDPNRCEDLWEIRKDFLEVPARLLLESPWLVEISRGWRSRPVTHEGEARAGVGAAELESSRSGNCGRRQLLVGDNLGMVLAFERKRAHAFPVLVQIRRLAALELAKLWRFSHRWVPSEANPADEVSRIVDETPGRTTRAKASCPPDISILAELSKGTPAADAGRPRRFLDQAQGAFSLEPRGAGGAQAVVKEDPHWGTGDGTLTGAPVTGGRNDVEEAVLADSCGADQFQREPSGALSLAACVRGGGFRDALARARSDHREQGQLGAGGGAAGGGSRRWPGLRGVGGGIRSASRLDEAQAASGEIERHLAPGARRKRMANFVAGGERGHTEGDGAVLKVGGRRLVPQRGKGADHELPGGGGRRAGVPPHDDVLGGAGLCTGHEVSCGVGRPVPGVRERRPAPTRTMPPGHEGLEEACPAKVACWSGFLCDSRDRRHAGRDGLLVDGVLGVAGPWWLPTSEQHHEDQRSGLCTAGVWRERVLGAAAPPFEPRRDLKDWVPGRRSAVGRAGAEVFGAGLRAAQKPPTRPADFRLHVRAVGQEGAGGGGRLAGEVCSLSSPALRALVGPATSATLVVGDTEKGALEDVLQCPAVRKVDPQHVAVPRVAPRAAVASRGARRPAAAHHDAWREAPALPEHRRDAPGGQRRGAGKAGRGQKAAAPLVLDLFSGKDGVSKEVARLGGHAESYDIRKGPEHDLSQPDLVSYLVRRILQRKYRGVLLATPCTTFSTARDRNSQIRSRRSPWGLPGLTGQKAAAVKEGNKLARSTLRVFKACIQSNTRVLLENPATSRLFLLPCFRRLLSLPKVALGQFDMCQYGTAWRKPTAVLGANIGEEAWNQLCMKCHSRGRCSRTGKPHLALSGNNAENIPWTKIAQTYPKKLCVVLATILMAR